MFNKEVEARIKEMSEHENLKDIFVYRDPAEVWFDNGEKSEVLEYIDYSVKNFSANHRAACVRLKNFGLAPYSKRHEVLDGFLFSKKENIGDFVFKVIPQWFNDVFPRHYNALTADIFKHITYDVFDSGVFDTKVWKFIRDKMKSPMDKRELSKPKLGNIIKYLVINGIANKELEDKYNSRVKSRDSLELFNCSANPLDFLRVSLSNQWSSCVNKSGIYNETILCYLINPTKVVLYIDDEELLKKDRMRAAKARCIVHLAGNYSFYNGKSATTFDRLFQKIKEYAFEGNREVFNYKAVLNSWHIVPDRVYSGSNMMLAPIVHVLYNRCKELGLQLSLPSSYNSEQDGGTRANFSFEEKEFLVTPIVTVGGWHNYSDNFGTSHSKEDHVYHSALNVNVSSDYIASKLYAQYIHGYTVSEKEEVIKTLLKGK